MRNFVLRHWMQPVLPVLIVLIAALAAPVRAQVPQDFVGDWSVEGGALGPCSITLSGQAIGGQLKATTYNCTGSLSFAWAWEPSGDGIVINGLNNMRIATLRPARGALVGQTPDGSLVTLRPKSGQQFGRPNFPPTASFPTPVAPGQAGQACYLRADTGRCAGPEDLQPPRRKAFVRATYDLNVRAAVDMSSPVIGQVKAGQCFTINWCRDSRWGMRCEVQMDRAGHVGYTIKYYEDKGQDYIAFTNECR